MQLVYKIIISVWALFVFSFIAKAFEGINYNVANIDPVLLVNADAVMRIDDSEINIISPAKVEWHKRYAITILKESALEKSYETIGYSKTFKINNINATIYDSKGEKIKRIAQQDILDYSAIDDGTMYSDSRVKYINPKYQSYPFTIEYEYSITINTAFILPSYSPFCHFNTSIEKSSIKLTAPTEHKIRYKEYNNIGSCKITKTEEAVEYAWSYSKLKAPTEEPYSVDVYDIFPYVAIAPSEFEYEGYKGNLNTWLNFGLFISQLNKGKDDVPLNTATKMQELVKNCTSDYEKVQKIYAYAQQKNRYVSIQLGIGGLQPFPASTVDEVSYGDCKALSNYTKALLNCVGIRSVYAIIEAGEDIGQMDTSFVHNPFNHAVLCVPLVNDTIWLECTNPHIPCGYFGDFTHNRYALLVDGDQSRLVKTTAMKGANNSVNRTGTIVLQSDGYAKASMETRFAGINYGNYIGFMLMDDKDRKEYIIKHITIPNFQLVNYKLTDNRNGNPYIQLNTTVDLPNFMTQNGTRLIMPINQYNAQKYIPAYARKRESPLKLVNDQVECDTVVYQLPANYKVEVLPQPVAIDTQFGSYKSRCEATDGQIIYYRYFTINDGLYKPEMYNEFRAFLEKTAAADNAKCIVVAQ